MGQVNHKDGDPRNNDPDNLEVIDDEDEWDEEDEELDDEIIRAKWIIDGSATLGEAAAALRAEADRLEGLEREGYRLRRPVEDDYGFIFKPTLVG